MKKIDLGLIRLAVLRSLPLLHVFTSAGVWYLVIIEGGFKWWYLVLGVVMVALSVFDMKVVWQQEKNHIFDNDKMNEVLEILRRLDRD